MKVLVGIGLLIVLVPSCSMGEVKQCTLVACSSTTRLNEVPAAIDRSAPERITVTYCRNGDCVASKVEPIPGVAERLRCNGGIVCTIGPGTFSAQISHLSTTPLADGDVVRITVDDASGRVFDTGDRTVTYTIDQPNGPECEPTCRSTTL